MKRCVNLAGRAAAVITLLLGLVGCSGAAPSAGTASSAQPTVAQAAPGLSPDQVALYRGADRQQQLEAGARREGKLTWYTTTIVNQLARPLADAFHEKYPFIEVETWRSDATQVAERIVQEYKAGHYEVDITDGTSTPSILQAADAIQPFYSPNLDPYPANTKSKDGYWATELLYFMVLGYNTQLVSKQDVPKTYQDLLDPKWKGKMGWSTSVGSGAPSFVGNILETMGQDKGMEYLQKLAQQDMINVDSSGRAVLDQVIAGQFPIGVQIFNDQASFSASQGAPVAWQPLEPVLAQLSRIALAKHAPHPNASMLFLDFLFSEDGQRVIRDGDGLPPHPSIEAKVPTLKPDKGGFTANYLDPDETAKNQAQWNQIYRKLFFG